LLLPFHGEARSSQAIGRYVARIIEDESTSQVGFGIILNAVVSCLVRKKHLEVHTELLSDGIIYVMERGMVDSEKANGFKSRMVI